YVDRASSEERVASGPFVAQSALAAALADPNPATAFDAFGDGSYTNPATLAGLRQDDFSRRTVDQWEANLTAHGPIADWDGRQIELALGSDWRYETLDAWQINAAEVAAASHLQSHAAAVFGELSIPIVTSSQPAWWARQARASLAARYESDAGLGSGLTPRAGLDWSPIAHFTLEGSWGRSFSAPDLADLDESANQLAITVLPDPKSPSGTSAVLLWTGGNEDLRDETATTWTAGARFDALADRLTFAVTYFDIDYVGRIERIDYSASFLTDPVYAALVTRDPTPAERQNACGRGMFVGTAADCTGAPIAALIDMRLNNVAATQTSGFDLAAKYRTVLRAGELESGLDATYLLAFRQTQFDGTPSENLLDTTGYPIDLRLRGTLSFRHGPFTAAGAVNYFDSYRDTFSDPERRIGSWTTVDLQLSYALGQGGPAALAGTAVTLAAQNVLNTNPPFVDNPAGVGYDPENADLLGRLMSLTLRKDW
ncbi:MAG: TonB-dependent receptor domain-containing protein, partial [Steroidobacteraceae bacterium]